MPPPRPSRYDSWVLEVIDAVTCILMYPFLQITSLGASHCVLITADNASLPYHILRCLVMGPISLVLAFVFAPLVFIGYVLWVLLNKFADVQPFYYVSPSCQQPSVYKEGSECASKFTFCSANVLLSSKIVECINNVRCGSGRVHKIARGLLQQDPSLNDSRNLHPPTKRENIVQSKLPEVDVIILQEVLERSRAKQLIKYFESKYPYCIYDVSVHSMTTNLCAVGSGLFLASRYPVLEATFHPFTYKTHYGIFLDLGILTENSEAVRGVGYVTNIHTQLEEVRQRVKSYISNTHNPQNEVVVFSVIGGDFNCDNMSPGDAGTQDLPLWDEYKDPCRECAGTDKPWTVGTEHRQRRLHDPVLEKPEIFRDILLDDVQRRIFMLDANIKEQTLELMWVNPKPGPSGMVEAIKEGGRRRIDHLILRNGDMVKPTAFWFSTVIGGLSDHMPVALTVERKL
ncbi:Sphingomyelin phosphodiesterase 3-like [Homarus americanus]|uniref:sphingomyelin phosphodiesterase n=1 Tax=Homarus americanus TaxID=6706 RepID=A0A8J5MV90_HOMAM|nr:Sphingomyelin phosphodiesterase 3-like [Homarus americanus]